MKVLTFILPMIGLALVVAMCAAKRRRDGIGLLFAILGPATFMIYLYPPRAEAPPPVAAAKHFRPSSSIETPMERYFKLVANVREALKHLEGLVNSDQSLFISQEDEIHHRVYKLGKKYPQLWKDLGHPNIQDYEGFAAYLEVLHDENDDHEKKSRVFAVR